MSWKKRGSLLAVLTLMAVLMSGTAVVQAQDGVTLTPGAGATRQEELLAEALGALVQAGFNPADFDFEKAVFDPQGRAVFLPVRATEEVRRQARAFVQNEQRFLLAGLLYARQSFEFQGKRYTGLHPVILQNPEAPRLQPSQESWANALVIPWQPDEVQARLFYLDPGDGGGSTDTNGSPDPTLCAFLGGLTFGLTSGGALVAATVTFLTAVAIGCIG